MRITQGQLRQIILEELQREFMSTRRLKLSNSGDLPPIEPPSPPERDDGPRGGSGIISWHISPGKMKYNAGHGTAYGENGKVLGHFTLSHFFSKWNIDQTIAMDLQAKALQILEQFGDDVIVTLDFGGGGDPRAKVTRFTRSKD